MTVKVTTTLGDPRFLTYENVKGWIFGADTVRILGEDGNVVAEFDRRAISFVEKLQS